MEQQINIYNQHNPIYFAELQFLVKNYPLSYFNQLKAKYSKTFGKSLQYLNNWICENTPLLNDPKFKISTKVNWILTGRTDFQKCKICGKYIGKDTNLAFNGQYQKYCNDCRYIEVGQTISQSLRTLSLDDEWKSDVVKKRKLTNELRHGDPNWNNIEKNKSTCINKYGVDNVRKSEYCKRKIKSTKFDRYGDENYVNISKSRLTNQLNHGVDWPMQSHDIRKKAAKGYVYDNQIFDSKGELCYYVWLKDNNISFIFQPKIAFDYECDGKIHKYFPDFLVEGDYVELKGNQFFKFDGTMQNPYDHTLDNLYEAKHQCMINNNVKILKHCDYIKYIDYVNTKYGKQFILNSKDNYDYLRNN